MSLATIARVSMALTIALFTAAEAREAAPADESPQQVVEEFHQSLLGAMQNAKRLGYDGRYKQLSPAVEKSFHLRFMTGVVAGYHWRKFSSTQKDALVEAFSRMTAATYARRFNGYSGEKFRVLGEQPDRRKSVLVKSQIVKSNGEKVVLNYKLKKLEDRWGIIDIHLTGTFSEIATRRSEYSAVIRRDGLDGLLRQINKKIRSYENGG